MTLVFMLGIGLATGIASHPAWEEASLVSTGALIVAGFGPLGGFGKFCGVIVALGVISNSIPGMYSAALGCQVLGRYGKMVPQYVWSLVLIVIQLVLALARREHLMVIISNFVASVHGVHRGGGNISSISESGRVALGLTGPSGRISSTCRLGMLR